MRVIVEGEEAAFCVFHDAEVVVDVFLHAAGGEDVVVGAVGGVDVGCFVRGGVGRWLLACIADGAVGGRGEGGGVGTLLAFNVGIGDEG